MGRTLHIAIALFATVAAAKTPAGEVHFNYLKADAVNLQSAIPAPPSPGSAEDKADIDQVLKRQTTRSAADCARAGSEVKISLDSFYGPANGPLSAEQVKAWTPVFEKVFADARYFIMQAKDQWHRPRPFVANSAVHPCVKLEPTLSYPSGHSTTAHLFALILQQMEPKLKDAIAKRADQIADDRVMSGEHHPADIAAGATLAGLLYRNLSASPAFQADIAGLKRVAVRE